MPCLEPVRTMLRGEEGEAEERRCGRKVVRPWRGPKKLVEKIWGGQWGGERGGGAETDLVVRVGAVPPAWHLHAGVQHEEPDAAREALVDFRFEGGPLFGLRYVHYVCLCVYLRLPRSLERGSNCGEIRRMHVHERQLHAMPGAKLCYS